LTDFSSPENTRNNLKLLAGTAPSVDTGQSFTIAENTTNGTFVGQVLGSDVDGETLQSLAIVGGDSGGAFSIDGTTGNITVSDESLLDYETVTSFTLSVTVSDGTLTSTAENVVIELTDVNEFAPVVNSAGPFTIAENLADNTSVGTALSADDQDGTTNLHNWAIASGNMIYPLIMNSLKQFYTNVSRQFFESPVVVPVVFEFHEKLVAAYKSKNASGARKIMRELLAHGEEHVIV